VREIWFVDPENQQLIIDRKREPGYREEVITQGKATSEVLKGFWINVEWLWTRPRPTKKACLDAILSEL
jgi:hypothetical protein